MLKIEIKEKGSESFYREVVNFQAQYRFILRNPARKLKDYFKQFRTLLILGSVFLVALIFMSIFWGASTLDYAIMAALAIAMAMCLAYLHMLGKALKTLMNDSRSSVLILDDSGVELNKEDSQIVKLAWSNISFIRLYANSLTFVSADQTGLIISIAKNYAGDIVSWMKDNQPNVSITGGL